MLKLNQLLGTAGSTGAVRLPPAGNVTRFVGFAAPPPEEATLTRLVAVPPPSDTADVAPRVITIKALPTVRLREGIRARVRYEDREWIAEALHLPLYGNGETEQEAVEMLAREIESLWQDLNEDARYGRDMMLALRFLQNVIKA